ncbi:MAG: dienelactone hydrolase family protein [Legionella sp.]|nr:dienelactone hydrolase family protein [Legionella sp.]
MQTSTVIYHHGNEAFHGFVASNSENKQPRAAVLVAHDWSGQNNFARQKAEMLAKMGYIGFAIDMYGHGRTGDNNDEKMALMQPLLEDRGLLRARMQAALDALIALPEVDSSRIGAIGFCFGGLCVLDLARSGANVRGVVSFHGLLNRPEHLPDETIKAKVLALHGYDDPMVKPDAVNAFCQEMTKAQVDWQVHQYGHTEHAFTNPDAHDEKLGTIYNARAERRSLQAMADFFQEIMV